jgi:hypothetical protein
MIAGIAALPDEEAGSRAEDALDAPILDDDLCLVSSWSRSAVLGCEFQMRWMKRTGWQLSMNCD